MEHVFPGFSGIIADYAIKDSLFDGIFNIPDCLAGWELKCLHDLFPADGRLEIPDRILLFDFFQFLAHDLEICKESTNFLFIFGRDVRFGKCHQVVDVVACVKKEAAHGRIALLCQRRFELGMEVSLSQARQAFPLVVFAHKCEDNSRKVMDISEVYVAPGGQAEYRCLYRYNITENEYKNGHFTIKGDFEKVNPPSGHLCTILTRSGVPQELLGRFCTGRKEAEAE